VIKGLHETPLYNLDNKQTFYLNIPYHHIHGQTLIFNFMYSYIHVLCSLSKSILLFMDIFAMYLICHCTYKNSLTLIQIQQNVYISTYIYITHHKINGCKAMFIANCKIVNA